MRQHIVYFDDDLKVYRFVTKQGSDDERAARATAIRKWAIANGYPDLAGKRGRLPIDVVENYFKGAING